MVIRFVCGDAPLVSAAGVVGTGAPFVDDGWFFRDDGSAFASGERWRASGRGRRDNFRTQCDRGQLTLSPYFCFNRRVDDNKEHRPEDLLTGPTLTLAADAARVNGVFVHASLWEASPLDESGAADGLGYNTAILVDPRAELVSRTRKLHIPRTAGYYEHEH
jgi:hypothetical protein